MSEVHSDSSAGKKKRKSVPRSSAGCITCKVRHIKCDEQRPVCLNCSKGGRQCEGFAISRRGTDQAAIKIVHWKQPQTLRLYQLTVGLAGKSEERRAFQFFRSECAASLEGYFDSSFWTTLVLQASHAEPTIRHAVIALGSLHETVRNKSPAPSENGKTNDCFALQQCNKAISHLTQDLSVKGKQSIDVLLMSCVIFACFESLQGNFDSALNHMRSGVRIYRNWQAEQIRPIPSANFGLYEEQQAVDTEIAQMFSRLNLQTLMHVCTDPQQQDALFYVQSVNPAIDPLPEAFSSLKEARDQLDNCTSYIFQSAVAIFFKGENSVEDPQHQSVKLQGHRDLLFQWSSALGNFVARGGAKLGPRHHQRLMLLEVQYKTAKILFETGLAPEETAFDAFDSQFENLLSIASLLANDSALALPNQAGQFSFEMGIVPHLYFTATRCRDPVIRRRALELMSEASRHEGVWDSHVMFAIAERLMSVEEESVTGQVTCSKDVPASSRISVLNATIYSETRRILVECYRPPRDPVGNIFLFDEWITY